MSRRCTRFSSLVFRLLAVVVVVAADTEKDADGEWLSLFNYTAESAIKDDDERLSLLDDAAEPATGDGGKRLSLLTDAARRIGVTSERLTTNVNTVFLNDAAYVVYGYFEGPEKRGFHDTTLALLYTCLNCVLARHVRDELVELIEFLSPLYGPQFQSPFPNPQFLKLRHLLRHADRHPLDLFFVHFANGPDETLRRLTGRTERYARLLLNFTAAYSSARDSTIDTTVLRALLSLRLRIDFVRALHDDGRSADDDAERSDATVMRLMLGVANSIRNFELQNCGLDAPRPRDHNRRLFGVPRSGVEDAAGRADAFLRGVAPLSLETGAVCGARQIKLLGNVPLTFAHVTWFAVDDGLTCVAHAVRRIARSTDPELLFWYQGRMIDTIMKYLFTKILERVSDLTQTVVDGLRTIRSHLISSATRLSPDLVKCFSLVVSDKFGRSEDPGAILTISNYLNKSLKYIHYSQADSERFEDVHKSSPYMKDVRISELEEYVAYLIDIMDDLKCFVHYFGFLHGEHYKHSESFAVKTIKTRSFQRLLARDFSTYGADTKIPLKSKETQVEESRYLDLNSCNYIAGLYQYSFNSMAYINIALSENDDNYIVFKTFTKLATSHLSLVRSFCMALIASYWHITHHEIVYKLLPIIELLLDFVFPEDSVWDDLERVPLMIMNQLDSYSIEFCDSSKYSLLLFDNLNFEWIGQFKTKSHSFVTDAIKEIKYMKPIDLTDHEYTPIRDLIIEFKDLHFKFQWYAEIILLMWRGKKKNIAYINDFFEYSILNAPNLYVLYDIYFKFSLAVMFYELCNAVEMEETLYKIASTALHSHYPTPYHYITKRIFDYIISRLLNVPEHGLKDQIDNIFKNIGVSINYHISKPKTIDDERAKTIIVDEDHSRVFTQRVINFIKDVYKNYEKNCIYGQACLADILKL